MGGRGLVPAVTSSLRQYSIEWNRLLKARAGRPVHDKGAPVCQDLHPRCPEWAALVWLQPVQPLA